MGHDKKASFGLSRKRSAAIIARIVSGVAAVAIVIVGLGTGAWEQLTIEAREVLEQASEVYLRTTIHPAVAHLPKRLRRHSLDQLCQSLPSPDAAHEAIVQRILELGLRPQGVIYAVPGHPLVGEATVRRVLREAEKRGIAVKLVPGLSFLDAAITVLNLDPLAKGLQVVDALEPRFDPTLPTIVAHVYDQPTVSHLKAKLLEAFPPEHVVTWVHWTTIRGKTQVQSLPLSVIDRRLPPRDHWSCLFIPPLTPVQNLTGFATLRQIMAKLRSPEGCPWDREQTHSSIKHNLLEECYEVIEALDEGDVAKLSEELGDLLMQVAFHAQLAEEANEFTIEDVLRSINAKLLRRHPHVFGNLRVENSQEVLTHWEAIKRFERTADASILSTVPKAMPALAQSQALQDRAARAGFDWREVTGVLEQLASEVQELSQAPDTKRRAEEFGDLLFTLVNVGRWIGVDAEEALRLANQRFYRRFTYMERAWAKQGRNPQGMNIDEMNALWEEAKRQEAGRQEPP